MGNAAAMVQRNGKRLSNVQARFYATQRKLTFAPVVGHERLFKAVEEMKSGNNALERSYLTEQGLGLFAATSAPPIEYIEQIRTVTPGTILFAGQPIADIVGDFGVAQAQEIKFEHSFDEPMTVAARALEMKLAAENFPIMDFSLRRNGSAERAREVSYYSYLGGFDSTSNLDAGFTSDIPVVGTMAHYWVQAFVGAGTSEKHFQQVAFEAWLDANPNGTVLLIDTINFTLGLKHAI